MDEAKESGSIGFEVLKAHYLKQIFENRESGASSLRVGGENGIVGNDVSRWHCVEDLVGDPE